MRTSSFAVRVPVADCARAQEVLREAGIDHALDDRWGSLYPDHRVLRADLVSDSADVDDLLRSTVTALRVAGIAAEPQSLSTYRPQKLRRYSVYKRTGLTRRALGVTLFATDPAELRKQLELLSPRIDADPAHLVTEEVYSESPPTGMYWLILVVLLCILGGFLVLLWRQISEGDWDPRELVLLFAAVAVVALIIVPGIVYFFHQTTLPLTAVLAVLPVCLLLCTGAVYLISRGAYEEFYQPFGVTPEEVGFDYRTILNRQGLQGVTLVVGLLAVVLGTYGWIRRFLPSTSRLLRMSTVLATILAATVSIGLVNSNTRKDASFFAESVSVGDVRVPRNRFVRPPSVVAVRAMWVTAQPPSIDLTESLYYYLGGTDAVAVLFAPESVRTIRVPRAGLALYGASRLSITGRRFIPAEITLVGKNPVMTLSNRTNQRHSFTIEGASSIDVELRPAVAETIVIASNPGDYRFFCKFHGIEGMSGLVRVVV